MKLPASICVLFSLSLVASAEEGIEIRPDENGLFEYADDFQSPRFLIDGFVTGFRPQVWGPGSVRNQGPHRWSLVYRFHGRRAIRDLDIKVEQAANGPSLGARNDVRRILLF